MRGFVYTIEAMLAIALVTGSMIFIFNLLPQTKQGNIPVIKASGYSALEFLDVTDELRAYISENKVGKELSKNITALLPVNLEFSFEICEPNKDCSISKVTTNRTVVAMDYYISGYRDKFVNKKIRLWLWEKF